MRTQLGCQESGKKFQAVGLKIVQTHRLEFFLDDDGAWSQA